MDRPAYVESAAVLCRVRTLGQTKFKLFLDKMLHRGQDDVNGDFLRRQPLSPDRFGPRAVASEGRDSAAPDSSDLAAVARK